MTFNFHISILILTHNGNQKNRYSRFISFLDKIERLQENLKISHNLWSNPIKRVKTRLLNRYGDNRNKIKIRGEKRRFEERDARNEMRDSRCEMRDSGCEMWGARDEVRDASFRRRHACLARLPYNTNHAYKHITNRRCWEAQNWQLKADGSLNFGTKVPPMS